MRGTLNKQVIWWSYNCFQGGKNDKILSPKTAAGSAIQVFVICTKSLCYLLLIIAILCDYHFYWYASSLIMQLVLTSPNLVIFQWMRRQIYFFSRWQKCISKLLYFALTPLMTKKKGLWGGGGVGILLDLWLRHNNYFCSQICTPPTMAF